MATPVPVVSIMYFFDLFPPKTLVNVSPAFSAISTKLTAGCGVGAADLDCCAQTAILTNRIRNVVILERSEGCMQCDLNLQRFAPLQDDTLLNISSKK